MNSSSIEFKMDKQLLIQLYIIEKRNITQIAEIYKKSYTYTRNQLLKHKIPIRTLRQALKGINKGNKRPDLSILNKKRKKQGFYNNKNHPSYKDGRTLKQYYCKDCEKEISLTSGLYGNGYCKSCYEKGERHPFWIQDRTLKEYGDDFTKDLKEEIRQRDNYVCQNCNMSQEEHYMVYGKNLHVHHIDYNKKNNNKDNLITLCNACNIRANFNRDYWENYYNEQFFRHLV